MHVVLCSRLVRLHVSVVDAIVNVVSFFPLTNADKFLLKFKTFLLMLCRERTLKCNKQLTSSPRDAELAQYAYFE